jgi:NADH:ubiquinone reductase (H+-translocating)
VQEKRRFGETMGSIESSSLRDDSPFWPRRPAGGNAGPQRARVLIVGSGFGGLTCARALDRTSVDVLLLDRTGYHLFTPLLYQVATALLNPSDIAYPLRTVFRHSPNVRVHQTTVERAQLEKRCVSLHTGQEVPYDYLVLATGSADNYFGNERLAQVSIGLKSLEEAARLRNHVLACLERADCTEDAQERRALLTFVVAGGGPTGVEYSGALGELIELVAGRDFPTVAREGVRIVLVEGRERVLGAFSERLGRYAERILSKRGIEVLTGKLVETADDRSVTLSGGTVVPTRTLVWTGGVRPLVLRAEPALPLTGSKRGQVDAHLRVAGAENVFLIGDAAAFLEGGTELPMLSAPAMQQARYVAKSILAKQAGRRVEKPFQYIDKGTMATIGRNAAVAHLRGGLELTGLLGWLAWVFVHIWYLVGFRNRVAALSAWGWNYLRFDRPIRIILQADRDPAANSLLGRGMSEGPK